MICIKLLSLILILKGTFGLPGRYCLNPDEYPFPRTGKCEAGETCQPIPGSQYGQCVPDLDSTGKYCSDQSQCGTSETCTFYGKPYGQCKLTKPRLRYCFSDEKCKNNEKCAASGYPDQGICKPKTDPTGRYCTRSRDCAWHKFEKCKNNECKKLFSG